MFLVKELQSFVPALTAADISRGPAGVRAMAMNANGDLIPEFIFDTPPKVAKITTDVIRQSNHEI